MESILKWVEELEAVVGVVVSVEEEWMVDDELRREDGGFYTLFLNPSWSRLEGTGYRRC